IRTWTAPCLFHSSTFTVVNLTSAPHEREGTMPSRLKSALILAFAVSLTLAIGAQQPAIPNGSASSMSPRSLGRTPLVPPGPQSPISVIGAIAVPPFLSSVDIMWVDQIRGRLYIADRSNAGVDIIDAVTSTYLGRIPG